MKDKSTQITLLFECFKKVNLSLKEMATVIGISKSAAEKIFYRHSERYILEHKILPSWIKVGKRRLWNLESIVQWLNDTETRL